MTIAIIQNNTTDPQAKVHRIVYKGRRTSHPSDSSSMPSQLLVRARLLQRLKRKSPCADNDDEDNHKNHHEEEEEDPVRSIHWMMPPRKRPLLRRQPSILGNLRRNYARRGAVTSHDNDDDLSDTEDAVVISSPSSVHPRRASYSKKFQRKVVSPAGSDYDEEEDDDDEVLSTCNNKRVHFSKFSSVKLIPHYSSYTMEERKAMWNGRKEIRRLARKNSKEYNFEGCRAENAVEEQDFVDLNGVRIHPAHLASPSSIANRKLMASKKNSAEGKVIHTIEL